MGAVVDLEIEGMSCASCVARVEKVLGQVPGVELASVNLATGRARVEGASGVSAEALVEAVEGAGYGASPVAPHAPRTSNHTETIRLAISAALTLPLLVPMISVGKIEVPGWVQLALATVVQFAVGWRFYVSAIKGLRNGAATMDLLVALGTTAAFALSAVELLLGGGAALYFESSAVVITLVLLGRWLEGTARHRAADAIEGLGRLQPERALVIGPHGDAPTLLDLVQVGDVIAVKPGARVPLDGRVTVGSGVVDESVITGESLPVEKRPGSRVIGGSLNGDTFLEVEVTATGADTVLSRMVRAVETAQMGKAPIQRVVDRVSGVFVPIVVLIAVATAAGWLLAGATAATALINAVSVLVIACPCAMGLATPIAIMVGVGQAAKRGILIRDMAVLELAHRITMVAFDKTGTLTEGRPAVTDVYPAAGHDAAEVLRLAATVQRGSEHPLARAVMAAAAGADLPLATEMTALPGRGVSGMSKGRALTMGNASLVGLQAIQRSGLAGEAAKLSSSGYTVSWLAADGEVLGVIGFGDHVRASAKSAVAQLRQLGISSMMLTGDNPDAAAVIAASVGIDDVEAGIMPDEKALRIARLRASGAVVGMVGDGVNDVAALAAADVSFAMSSGADIAMEAATVTLMRPEPTLVPEAIELSRRTWQKVRQGLFWAMAYNVLGIPLAAMGLLDPMIAGGAMALSSFSVVVNALTLRRIRPAA